jgi:hypothetical protein
MRPKVVAAILLLAVGLLGVIALVSKALRPQSTTSVDSGNVSLAATVSNPPVEAPARNPSPVVSIAPTAGTNDAAAHAQYVRQRIKELNVLAMNNDVQSRDTILSELKDNSDKKIRAAALEAAIQFGDRSVVPPLQEIAAQTQDPDEKAAILEAIDYINLPSLTEYMAANPNSTPGSAQTRSPSQRHAHTQSPPPSPDSGQQSPDSSQ